MNKALLLCLSILVIVPGSIVAADFEADVVTTSAGDLTITFIGHGTLMMSFADTIVHIDPWSRLADYTPMPKADLILLTHDHRDHLDTKAIEAIKTAETAVVLTEACSEKVTNGIIMENGDAMTVKGLRVEAVPAYNIVHMRDGKNPFHPKGRGNGYVITFGDKRVYIAGDTENTPEMKALENIDVAFLPMNLPYTMTPEMVADAARAFNPRVLYPYHFGDTDLTKLTDLLEGSGEIEIRVRAMK